MALSLISGGIDLSVGTIFALCNFTTMFCLLVLGWPIWATILATLAVGINDILIGYLKARPFLTTLVTLIILRATVNLLNNDFSVTFATGWIENDVWDFIAAGKIFSIPVCLSSAFMRQNIELKQYVLQMSESAVKTEGRFFKRSKYRCKLPGFSTGISSTNRNK